MATKIWIRQNDYYDSMILMQLNHFVSDMKGVTRAAILMGTDINKPFLFNYGFADQSLDEAGPNDLIICLETSDGKTLDEATAVIEKFLKEKGKRSRRGKRFASLERAYESFPDANLVFISVPGPFAGREARKALQRDLNVFLFSDNVPLEQEVELKQLAGKKNLLLMGPDCGTAIIDGVGLGFANAVRRGPVGIVGAAGTGIQELCMILEKFGNLGVSHAIGVGGRDLSDAVQGMGTCQGLQLLGEDRETKCIIFLSKPPSESVSIKILEKVRKLGKPAVICFLGKSLYGPGDLKEDRHTISTVQSIEEAALQAIHILGCKVNQELVISPEEMHSLAKREAEKLKPDQRFVRAIFSGGSFCYESMAYLSRVIDRLHSNTPIPGVTKLVNSLTSLENSFLDMGEDEFTRGRVHPMIDPIPVADRIRIEAKDPCTGVILFDVILGYGSHADPGPIFARAVADAKEESEGHGRHLAIITHVCGTEGDPQDRAKQEEHLRNAGALLMQTNLQATKFVAAIMRKKSK